MKSIAELEKRIHYLEKENQYLKNLLTDAGISYSEKMTDDGSNEYDPTPVAWKGVVEQYAGRLNRDYAGKKSVIIYDYVDSHISMFDRMYHKRLKAYKQIGYDIFSGTGADKQTTNAIFDIDNYVDIYQNDLLTADKEIIISSPAISSQKVYTMIQLLN